MGRKPTEELLDLEEVLLFSGYKKDSEKLKAALRARRVEMCREFKGLTSCTSCPAYIACTLAEQHFVDLKYGVVEENRDEQRQQRADPPGREGGSSGGSSTTR